MTPPEMIVFGVAGVVFIVLLKVELYILRREILKMRARLNALETWKNYGWPAAKRRS